MQYHTVPTLLILLPKGYVKYDVTEVSMGGGIWIVRAMSYELLSFGQLGMQVGEENRSMLSELGLSFFSTACSPDVHIGLDMEGQIHDVTMTDSYQQCQKRCTNDNRCHFFTYASETFHDASFR